MADDDRSPEDEFQELLRQLLGGGGGEIDAEQLSRLSGMNIDPAMMQKLMQQLQGAFAGGGDGGISWDLAKRQALHIANQDGLGVTTGQRTDLDQAFSLATLWLSEATTISELAAPAADDARRLGRGDAAVLAGARRAGRHEHRGRADRRTERTGAGRHAGSRRGCGPPHAHRRRVAVRVPARAGRGDLSKEVVSGGDVGIPIMPDGVAAILPQNFADFGRDLEIPDDQLALYIAIRELAHARLFRHARWLRLHVISQVTEFARGVHVDTDALEDLASRFNPSEPEELRRALESGALLPARSEAQNAALARLENLLATIEGWVDVVTENAAARLPSADRIAEAVRRRRAVGGPAERALGSLVGLELRPRRMREAAAMWRAVTDAVGVAGRDALWDYPDLMPTADDIDDPAALVARLEARARGEVPAPDEMDDALARLLAGEAGAGRNPTTTSA